MLRYNIKKSGLNNTLYGPYIMGHALGQKYFHSFMLMVSKPRKVVSACFDVNPNIPFLLFTGPDQLFHITTKTLELNFRTQIESKTLEYGF